MATLRAALIWASIALIATVKGECTEYMASNAVVDSSVSSAFGLHALYLFDTSLTNGVQRFVWASSGMFDINGTSATLSGRLIASGSTDMNSGFDLTLSLTAAAAGDMYMGMNELNAGVTVDTASWMFWIVNQPSFITGFGSFSGTYQLEQQKPDMPFQIGVGASGKNLAFGAAVWLNIIRPDGTKIASDINIDLNCTNTNNVCPNSNGYAASAAYVDQYAKNTGGAAFSFFNAPASLGSVMAWVFVDNSGLLRLSNGQIHLSGVIVPASFTPAPIPNLRFTVNLLFTAAPAGFMAMPHKELIDSAYSENNGPIDSSMWTHYFIDSASSTITDGQGVNIVLSTQMDMPLQIGLGANGKNIRFGASGWFDYTVGTFQGSMDINIDLDCPMMNSTSSSESSSMASSSESASSMSSSMASSDSSQSASSMSSSSSSEDATCSVSVSVNQANTWMENGRLTRLVYVTLTNTGSRAITNVNLAINDHGDDCSAFAPSCIRQFWSMGGCAATTDAATCNFSLPDWLTQFGGLRVGGVHNWGYITYSSQTDIVVTPSCV